MILEALKFLSELSRKGDAPQPILPDDPRTARYVCQGQMVQVERPAKPRAHVVKSLDEIIALANRFHTAGSTPVVWYGEVAVVAVFDDDEHRVETAILPLVTAEVFGKLAELADDSPYLDQKAFVRFLRLELGRAAEPRLLEIVRRLEFENGQLASGFVGRGEESLGRTIRSKVQAGAGDLPEETIVTTRVYSTAGETTTYPVACNLDVEPAKCALRLVPMPDVIEHVRQLAMGSIQERLLEGLAEGVPCYYGTP